LQQAVVIYGALQKILHSPIADIMLKIGLTTEAVLFMCYGILYIIYPAMDEHEVHIPGIEAIDKGNPALKSMEQMLKEADITPVNLSKLSTGFQKLGDTVGKMGEISDVVKSTGDFTASTKNATTALTAVATSVNQAAVTFQAFNAASETTKQFHGTGSSIN
jgi:hypothetical protein